MPDPSTRHDLREVAQAALDSVSGRAGRFPVWGGLLGGAAMFAYSWYGEHYGHPADDAGITLRYAERIARGLGFNYNDGEAVNGASTPLHTLLEAALLRIGIAPETTILLIASVCLALTAGVLFATFARFYSRGAAVFAVIALVASTMPFDSSIDGMETPIVMLLVALLFRALHARGELFSGIVLGCLVANKLDGALAAIAFTAVFVAGRRRFPWRAAGIALLAAAPVFLLLLASFGSIVPNSMLTKMSSYAWKASLHPLWMHRLLLGSMGILYSCAWASILWLPLSRELRRSFPVAVLQLWFVLHMVAFATVNMGGPYGWYAAAPATLTVILSAFVVHVVSCATLVRTRWPRLEWKPLELPRRAWPIALALTLGLGWKQGSLIASRLRTTPPDLAMPVHQSWNLGRQSAGVWLRKHTDGTELFATYEGLPSYEYGGPVYDIFLLNSKPDPRRRRRAAYALDGPIAADAEDAPAERWGRKLVATFRYDAKMGLYLLYAKPDSEIWKSGARHIVFPTPALFSGRPEENRGTRVPQRDNSWILPATGHAFFTVQSSSPPTLMFTPRLVCPPDPPSQDRTRVRLVVGVNGDELEAVEIVQDGAPVPVRAAAPELESGGRYTFEIDCSILGSEDPGRIQVDLAEILVRSGEPLRAEDFKLTFPRDRERIEHVATVGLPCGLSGP